MNTATPTGSDAAWLVALFDFSSAALGTAAAVAPRLEISAPKSKRSACGRCGGSGFLAEFRRVNGGACFRCKGAGYVDR
jgi:hypothetical protein